MRVFRLFKLVRHFAGLQSLLHTLKQAYQVLESIHFIMKIQHPQTSISGPSKTMIIRRRTIHFLVPFYLKLLQELGLLLVLVAVAILTYSSLAYFAEREAQVCFLVIDGFFSFFLWFYIVLFSSPIRLLLILLRGRHR